MRKQKRSGPTVWCCGSLDSVKRCTGGIESAGNVLILGSGLLPIIKLLEMNVSILVWGKEDGSRRVIDEKKLNRKQKKVEEVHSEDEGSSLKLRVVFVDLHNLHYLSTLGNFDTIFVHPKSFVGHKLLLFSVSITESLSGLFPTCRSIICCCSTLCDQIAIRYVNGAVLVGETNERFSSCDIPEISIPCVSATNVVSPSTLSCYKSVSITNLDPRLLKLPKSIQKPGRVVATFGVNQYRQMIPFVCLKDDTVLEIGCQHGITTLLIARHCTEGKVYGVDIGQQSIERAIAMQTERRTRTKRCSSSTSSSSLTHTTQTEMDQTLNEEIMILDNDFPEVQFKVGDGFDVEALAMSYSGVSVIFLDMGGLSSRHAVLDLASYMERLFRSFAPFLRTVVVKSLAALHLATRYCYLQQ
eukprot:TRINITY_DN4050_c0_g1_i10.p1 TRINITY_DN4050_c0_g1~~TRINITY_DN4050_c0_g1_i10.p1  ORF type:complete len:413 (-),score=59.09 TRINITY_DN4050_c0_g1_i10:1405-2643(-)